MLLFCCRYLILQPMWHKVTLCHIVWGIKLLELPWYRQNYSHITSTFASTFHWRNINERFSGLTLLLLRNLTAEHRNRIFANFAFGKKMYALHSGKGPTAPADLWHEADSVSWSHHRAVPAGTVAQGAWEPDQPITPGQVHPGQLHTKKSCPPKWQVLQVYKCFLCLFCFILF